MRLSEQEAAKYLGLSRRALQSWRHQDRVRVPFRIVGHRAFYETEDLDRYLDGTVIKPKEVSPKSNPSHER